MSPSKRRTTGSTPSNVAVPQPATNQRYTPPPILAARGRPWWSRLGWPLAILGLIVLVVGWVGAQTGAIAVPGDRHHVLSQVVGFGLVFVGIRLGSVRGDMHSTLRADDPNDLLGDIVERSTSTEGVSS